MRFLQQMFLLLLFFLSTAEAAPPTVTGTSTQYGFFGSSNTTPHTVPAGTNVVLVLIAKLTPTDSPSVTFGGVNLASVVIRDDTARQCEIWMLDDPNPSTADIVITSGATAAHAVGVVNLTNAAATPVRTANTNSATGSSTTPTLVVTAGEVEDLIIDVALTISGTAATPGAGQTLTTASTSGGNVEHQSSRESASAAGAVTMSWSGAPSNNWVMCGVPIISANPSAPTLAPRRSPRFFQ